MERRKYQTVDEYIGSFPEPVRGKLEELRKAIADTAPGAAEKISYGMPTFYLKGNLVHFAAYPRHIGFYPTPSGIEEFREELAGYMTSKGAVQFPIDGALPLALIKRIVGFRVRENAGKV